MFAIISMVADKLHSRSLTIFHLQINITNLEKRDMIFIVSKTILIQQP